MSRVIAVREDAGGLFIGFEVDRERLECSECTEDAAYRIRYTKDQEGRLQEHRFQVHRVIESEHPKHSDRIEIPL
jgi:hypothetical protein